MLLVTAIWAFCEGCLFFLVADIPVSWIGSRRGLRPAVAAAGTAAVMAAFGGLALVLAIRSYPAAMLRVLTALPGISPALADHAVDGWHAGGGMAMLAGFFCGVPHKL